MKSIWLWVGLVVACGFFLVERAQAAERTVVFNEIAWRGSSISTADEFIELKNVSDSQIDLAGWSIVDGVSGKKILDFNSERIAGQKYFLISRAAKNHLYTKGESVLNIDANLVLPSMTLSNTHFQFILLDDKGAAVDSAGDGQKPFFGEYEGQIASMARVDYSTSGTLANSWAPTNERLNLDENVLDYMTPESSAILSDIQPDQPTTCQKSPNVKFSEVMADPKVDYNLDGVVSSDDEWVELANISTGPVVLDGWIFADKSGKKFQISQTTIAPLSFLLIRRSQSKIALNNTGEILFLFDCTGDEADNLSVGNSKDNYSYAKWAEKWYFTSSITPEAENVIVEKASKTNPTIVQLEQNEGWRVKFSAEITSVERDRLSVSYKDMSIDIITASEDDFSVGEKVEIVGTNHSGANPVIDATSLARNEKPDSVKKIAAVKTEINSNSKNVSDDYYPQRFVFSSKEIEKIRLNFSQNSSILERILLYSYSIFQVILIILLYEIYCEQKR